MLSQLDLRKTLENLDGQNYKALKKIKGQYQFNGFTIIIDHVQGDPYAASSKFRIKLPMNLAAFPKDTFHNKIRNIALRDFLTRQFHQNTKRYSRQVGTGKGGLISIDNPGQQILERTSCLITPEDLEVRFIVGLPAEGRRILGFDAAKIICDFIPKIAENALLHKNLCAKTLYQHLTTAEDADWIRSQLKKHKLLAFIADGSILPRKSGIDDLPMESVKYPIPFKSPDNFAITLHCPHAGPIRGMGIYEGVTLIVGGGYHGKSTLLNAVELGVYNHIPGDGREKVITNDKAIKIRAEDGRNVCAVTIEPFIKDLPGGKSTTSFSTENASGSTSQAANIIEAIEAGAEALLIDEDTSATNFMIRDRRMQALIQKDLEPITPFTDRVRQIYEEFKISTVLVMGGSGDYFESADKVIAMNHYTPRDVTQRAHDIAKTHQTGRTQEGGSLFGTLQSRDLVRDSLSPFDRRNLLHIKTRKTDEIIYGQQCIDLSYTEQLVHESQLRAIATAMAFCYRHIPDSSKSMQNLLHDVTKIINNQSLTAIQEYPDGDLAYFRPLELACAINRLRTLVVKKGP